MDDGVLIICSILPWVPVAIWTIYYFLLSKKFVKHFCGSKRLMIYIPGYLTTSLKYQEIQQLSYQLLIYIKLCK